jgi:carbon monoxide dehydrogenase subunit G
MKLTFSINKPVAIIFGYLTDMDKFASIHPVITKIDKTGDDTFLVHETLKLGFIPYSFTYPVTIESDAAAHRVTIRATVMKMTHIEMDFTIHEEGGRSFVEETISFKSILPLKKAMEKIFREQHSLLFRNMDTI